MMWLEAGVSLVWIVDPRLKQVNVFRSREDSAIFKSDQTLTASVLLPGFSLPVSEIFET